MGEKNAEAMLKEAIKALAYIQSFLLPPGPGFGVVSYLVSTTLS